jgi:two-component system, OmpR family, heavy metal sensor histidine kinase CusS
MRASWSIVIRLASLYTGLSTLVLFVAGFLLYWALAQNLRSEEQNVLADKIAVLRQIVRERPDDRDALREEVEWESTARRQAVFYARLSLGDKTIVESPGIRSLIPASTVFPPPASVQQPIGKIARLRVSPPFLLAAADVVGGQQKYRYEVALDITNEEKLLADYKTKLVITVCLAAVVSAGLSTWIARRGIQPIKEITAAAQAITASALSERISRHAWPSELATLAAEFDQMLERLEASFVRLSRFSANIAHELRTPISNMMGEAEVALGRSLTVDEHRRVLASSLEECQRLARLIDSLLFLARTEAANFQIRKSSFDARESVNTVIEFYEALAYESQIELICAGQTLVWGDESLFRRAISNLLSNALTHVPAKGRVTIELQSDSTEARVTVCDNGSGVAPKDLPHLFDRFYRGSNSGDTAGTGLGLSIVKSIMQLHGGTVEIASEVGKGTRVLLRFPTATLGAAV